MRTHRSFEGVQLWRDAPTIRARCRGAYLAAARIEPILRRGRDEAILDLTFARDGALLIVPTIIVPTRFVGLRESEPLVWPAAVGAIVGDEAADEIRDRLLPWLVATTAGHALVGERFTFYAPEIEDVWEGARSAGFLGAAPLGRAWATLSPYVYARRLARGTSVLIAAATGPAGYAALAGVASRIHLTGVEPADGGAAVRWFGAPCSLGDDPAAETVIADVAQRERFAARGARRVWIGEGPGLAVTAPPVVPFDAAFATTRTRGPVVRIATIEAEEGTAAPRPAPPARGGSGGRIVLAIRPDGERFPDADTDEARALCALLRAEGFDAVVASTPGALAGADLLHVIGLHVPRAARDVVAAARSARIPVVITPQIEDVDTEGYWGSQVSDACFSLRADEAGISMLLDLLATRRLASATVSATTGLPEPEATAIKDALAMADGIAVCGPGEQRVCRERFGYQGPAELVAPFVARDPQAPTVWLSGREAFVLLVSPLDARSNALAALRAADRAGIPLVVAGPTADPAYCSLLHEYAYERGIVIEDPSEAVVAGLIGAARVYLDCSWISRGPGRIVRSAAEGAAVVASARGWGAELLAPSLEVADPADVDSIARALRSAWTRDPVASGLAERARAMVETRAPLDRLLGLYGRSAAARTAGP